MVYFYVVNILQPNEVYALCRRLLHTCIVHITYRLLVNFIVNFKFWLNLLQNVTSNFVSDVITVSSVSYLHRTFCSNRNCIIV